MFFALQKLFSFRRSYLLIVSLSVCAAGYPYFLNWLFGNPFSVDGYLAQPRYSREGLGPSLKQCALPSLRSEWGCGGGEDGGNGRKGGSRNWDCNVK